MREQLQWLIDNSQGWAAERARYALELTDLYQAGELGRSEYQELLEDLVRADKLQESADSLEIKNYLVSAIMIGAKLA